MPLDPKKHIIELQGSKYVTYAGVLHVAHEKGLRSIRTHLVQIPCPDNEYTAIVKATVALEGWDGDEGGPVIGRLFEAYGDASPRNVNSRIATALIRMAETRSKGRALRDAVNIGETLAEELAPEEPAERHEKPRALYDTSHSTSEELAKKSPIAAEWAEPTTGQVMPRTDLLKGCERLAAKASSLGIPVPAWNPKMTPNARLFAIGRELVEKIRKAGVVTAMEGKEDHFDDHEAPTVPGPDREEAVSA